MLTCVFIAGTLFMVDHIDAAPIGPSSHIQLMENGLNISVGNDLVFFPLTPEYRDTGLESILNDCETIAFDKLEPMEEEPMVFIPSNEKEI